MLTEQKDRIIRALVIAACGFACLAGPQTVLGQAYPDWDADPEQATSNIQAAINGNSFVRICNVGQPWVIQQIELLDNRTIEFEAGVLVQSDLAYEYSTSAALFLASGKSNVTLEGLDGDDSTPTIEMRAPHDDEYYWRHAISIRTCSGVTISGLRLKSTGGDGICLGVTSDATYNSNVTIDGCTTYECYRDGLSVISADGLTVTNCVFRDGVDLQGDTCYRGRGVLFEPNYATQRLANIRVRNCTAINNDDLGFGVTLHNMDGSSEDVDVLFQDCHVASNTGHAFGVSHSLESTDPKGTIVFRGCTCVDNGWQGAVVNLDTTDSLKVVFDGCRWDNVCTDTNDPNSRPLTLTTPCGGFQDPNSGIDFVACQVYDSSGQPFVKIEPECQDPNYADVEGDITVFSTDPDVASYNLPNLELVYAPVWDEDPNDATENIQACIDSGAEILRIPRVGPDQPWVIQEVTLASDQEIRFDAAAVVQSDPNWPAGTTECLFVGENLDNVALKGEVSTSDPILASIQMSLPDPNEYHHCLSLKSCDYVDVWDLQFSSSSADGINLASASGGSYTPNTYIDIDGCTTLKCVGYGLRVTNAQQLDVNDCVFRGVDGDNPTSGKRGGVCLWPTHVNERLYGVDFTDCTFQENKGNGVTVYLDNMDNTSTDVFVTFSGCAVLDSFDTAFWVSTDPNDAPAGIVTFSKCTATDINWLGAYVDSRTTWPIEVGFNACTWTNVSQGASWPLKLRSTTDYQGPYSGIRFTDCEVYDDDARVFVGVNNETPGSYEDIEGDIFVDNDNRVCDMGGVVLDNLTITYDPNCP